MQKANALQLRHNNGQIVKRFIDIDADISRPEMIKEIKNARLKLSKNISSLDLLRTLRSHFKSHAKE